MYIYSIICFILAIVGKKTEKKFLNPVTIFMSVWAIILYFSCLRLYTLYQASIKTYNYIMCGLISFFIGYYLLKLIFKNKYVHIKSGFKNERGDRKYVLRKKVCYVFAILCIIFLLINLFNYGKTLYQYGFNLGSAQKVLQETESTSSGLINAISFLIVNPMYIVLTVSIIVNFIAGDKDKKMLLLIILISLGRVLITGGRQAFIQLFIIIISTMSFTYNKDFIKFKQNENRNNKKKIIIFGIFAVVFLVILSLSRSSNIIKTIYLDFAMQPYMFEIWCKYIEEGNRYAYSFSSLSGFVYPALYIIKNFLHFFTEIPLFFNDIYSTNMLTIDKWVEIGKILKANAYVSIFWYFYYDARLFGIIFGSFILGIFSYNIYKKAYYYKTIKDISLYCMLILILFYSFGDLEISKPSFAIAIVYLLTVVFKKVNKE